MTTFQTVCSYICILISLVQASRAQDLLTTLMERAEYDLAQLEIYRTLQKDSTQGDSLQHLAQIAYLSQLQGQHAAASAQYTEVLQHRQMLTDGFHDSLRINLCYSLLELNQFASVYGMLHNLDPEDGRLLKKNFYVLTMERHKTPPEGLYSPSESTALDSLRHQLKHPEYARWMSILVPGLGQIYSEHLLDAVQIAVVMTAGIMYTAIAYENYSLDQSGAGLTLFTAGVTGLFYSANILSAYRTAIYRNIKLKQDFIRRMQWDHPPLRLVP